MGEPRWASHMLGLRDIILIDSTIQELGLLIYRNLKININLMNNVHLGTFNVNQIIIFQN